MNLEEHLPPVQQRLMKTYLENQYGGLKIFTSHSYNGFNMLTSKSNCSCSQWEKRAILPNFKTIQKYTEVLVESEVTIGMGPNNVYNVVEYEPSLPTLHSMNFDAQQ